MTGFDPRDSQLYIKIHNIYKYSKTFYSEPLSQGTERENCKKRCLRQRDREVAYYRVLLFIVEMNEIIEGEFKGRLRRFSPAGGTEW